jgi:hypothetical protein
MVPCLVTIFRCSLAEQAFAKARNQTLPFQLPLTIRTETRYTITSKNDRQKHLLTVQWIDKV